MSPFSFFKRKDKEISKVDNKISKRSNDTYNQDKKITINLALEKIKEEEENIIKDNLNKLTFIITSYYLPRGSFIYIFWGVVMVFPICSPLAIIMCPLTISSNGSTAFIKGLSFPFDVQ